MCVLADLRNVFVKCKRHFFQSEANNKYIELTQIKIPIAKKFINEIDFDFYFLFEF